MKGSSAAQSTWKGRGVLVTGASGFFGAWLAQALLEYDLVDELRLMVFPVVLGTRRRLFGETTDKKRMQLVQSRTVGEGIAILILRRAA